MDLENPLVFILGIIAVLAIIIWRLNDVLFFSFRAKRAKGTIVNWMAAKSGGKQLFFPVIEYEDEEGKSHKYRAEESCEGSPMYPVGTQVTVMYISSKPDQRKTRYPKV